MKAYAVIGALYGDEGKGMVTDWLSHKLGGDNVVVVRFNGGAQAAHTVQTPDGRRHVFHHFGSGSFTGARTHLSRFTVVNPMAFNEEWDALAKLDVEPRVTVDGMAYVTTPFDMLLNQALETVRGDQRHGSCGLGIGETVERCDESPALPREGLPMMGREFERPYATMVRDLPTLTGEKLDELRDWVEWRWEQLMRANGKKSTLIPNEYWRLIQDDAVLVSYLADVQKFLSRIEIVDDTHIPSLGTEIIFEGAQGLMLDPTIGEFPHVTRSNCGLLNVHALCRIAGIDEVHAHYVLRAYMTRHGAGPFPNETDHIPGVNFDDPTNVQNSWQGKMRIAPLNIVLLEKALARDRYSVQWDNRSGPRIETSLVMTCLDQLDDMRAATDLKLRPRRMTGRKPGSGWFAPALQLMATYGIESMDFFTSWGPTRATMHRSVVESYHLESLADLDRLIKLCGLNGIEYSHHENFRISAYNFFIDFKFDTEEQRQLIRLAATNTLTKRVAAL